MSKARFGALLGLVESDDDELDILIGSAPAAGKASGTMPPGRKPRSAAANPSNKATAAGAKASSRKALAEKAGNVQEKAAQGRGKKRLADEDLDLEVQDGGGKPKGGRGRPRAAKVQKSSEQDHDTAGHPAGATAQPTTKRGRKPKTKVASPPGDDEIPETQPAEIEIPESQPVQLIDSSLMDEEDEQVGDLPVHNIVGWSSIQRAQPHHSYGLGRRLPSVAASDSELHDPSMRRRVGDLTRKYETLEHKYRDLREIGVMEAERNYDRLKKQSEERADTASQLIATLKAQLSSQTELAKEAQGLRRQLEASQEQVEELQGKISGMDDSLIEAKTEIKTLSTKLSSARSSAEATGVKVPGSAIKGNSSNARLMANAEAATQVAQAKENLYGDLTGLIVCGVKREKNEEVFDCVQTGRNGTLHFKLVVGIDGADKYDDMQFMYLPQLDADRDQELVDMLPDYLVEEITFPRLHAAKFYARVMKALTERLD
ncbi:chromosome segregation protein Csm1/Pcs1-domain-containing protein [Xylariaceae sp. FL0804]|nr:chromosome segregation protein Csm1/Pcs1-domain-containing protein [Xylariaceae sp. FL0804]